MEENRLDKIARLDEAIKKLPAKIQDSIYWAVENFNVLEEMGKASNMTLEEIQKEMETALSEENYATLILLYITKFVRESKENEEI